MHSALYTGWLRHRRHSPKAHDFTYRLSMLWLDLAETDDLFAGRWLWSTRRTALARWCREDHLGDPRVALSDAVREEVRRQCGLTPTGPVRLLTHPRYFGFGFNPVSFYYCYAADGHTLEAIVAEVTNTPWGERHVYVLPTTQSLGGSERLDFRFPKEMHVSPFLPMDLVYRCRFTAPGDRLIVHMEDLDEECTVLDATLVLSRSEITGASLARALVRYPFMTGQVVADIHWQALRLWLKGIPIFDHPAVTPQENKPSA